MDVRERIDKFLDELKGDMTFCHYQKVAHKTAIYPAKSGINYNALALASEAGEVAGKFSKLIRDDHWSEGQPIPEEKKQVIFKEMGDVLWQLSELATCLGISLEEIARMNQIKLSGRQLGGTLTGSGDNR